MNHRHPQNPTKRKRGRPPLPPARRRTHVVRVQLNDAELRQLEQLMKRAGETARSAFCRDAALGNSNVNAPGRTLGRELRQLRTELFAIYRDRKLDSPVLQRIDVKLDELTTQLLGDPS